MAVLLSSYLIDVYNVNVLLCLFIILFSMIFANTMNDILDLKTDNINHPNRVLNQEKITKPEAKIICCLSLIISIALSVFLNGLYIKIFLYIILLLLFFYNIFFKKIAIIGNFIIALLLSNVFVFTEMLLTNKIDKLIIPSILAFTLSFIRENIKDLHDIKGDRLQAMKTLPIVLGIEKSCYFVSILILISGVIFLFPYLNGLYGIKYFISLLIFIEIPLLYSVFLLLNYQTIKTFKQLTNLYKNTYKCMTILHRRIMIL